MKNILNDEELFSTIRNELFTCVVGDVMDKMGLQHQFLPPQIRPLRPDMVLIGRAMPVLSVDVFEEKVEGTHNKLMERPFGLMLEALDDLRANEIYVNTGSSPRNALWGEMMSIRARKLGAAGARAERLFARHQSCAEVRLSRIQLGLLRAGCRAPLQGSGLSHCH